MGSESRKIYLLTLHRASNYGAALQTYATQRTLQKLGADAVILDYRCPQVEKDHHPFYYLISHAPRSALKRFPAKLWKYIIFQHFRRKTLQMTRSYRELSAFAHAEDVFLAGSDQIWSERFTAHDANYLLAFNQSGIKYSYASSIGYSQINDENREYYRKYLSAFRAISTREMSTGQALSTVLGKDVRVDLDPTMLLTRDEWMALSAPVHKAGKYILVYTVPGPIRLMEQAKKVAQREGLDILYLKNQQLIRPGKRRTGSVTPNQFIRLFAEAECVFTNSFHGTVFSILFRKPFCVETESDRGHNNRSEELLGRFGLQQHVMEKMAEISMQSLAMTHPEETEKLIQRYRSESMQYLKAIAEDKEEI